MSKFWNASRTDQPDAEFKLSITRALADQLATSLESLTPVPLTVDSIRQIQARPGIYQLFEASDLVYVGKASKSLVTRLTKHRIKLEGRGVEGVRFVCLYVDEDLEASAPEKMLIRRHKLAGDAVWNTNGFGNNDPGARRDMTAVKANHFDALHPIDLDYKIALSEPAAKTGTIVDALKYIKAKLPYLLRYDKATPTALGNARLEVDPTVPRPLSEWLRYIVSALPESWQATALPGYVILYQVSDPSAYPSATRYWRSAGGRILEVEVTPTWAPESEIKDESTDADEED